jgi:hypothetical protein
VFERKKIDPLSLFFYYFPAAAVRQIPTPTRPAPSLRFFLICALFAAVPGGVVPQTLSNVFAALHARYL